MVDDSLIQRHHGSDVECVTSSAGSTDVQLKKWDTTQAVRPVLVCQLVNAQQEYSKANFTIGGHEVKHVETVASVVSVTHSPLKISLVLEDGSKLGGRIIAHRWYHDLDISGNASVREKNEAIGIIEHQYVRVVGTLSRWNNRNSLEAVQIRKIANPHEIDFHFLDVFVVNMIYDRGPPPMENSARSIPQSEDSEPLENSSIVVDTRRPLQFQSDTAFAPSREISCAPVPTAPPLESDASYVDVDEDMLADVELGHRKGICEDTGASIDITDEDTSSQLSRLSLSWDQPEPSVPSSSPIGSGPSGSLPTSSFTFIHSTSSSSPHTRTAIGHDQTPGVSHLNNDVVFTPSTQSAIPASVSTPVKRKRDPYSHLNNIQRSIILYIQNAAHYLSGEGTHTHWDGVHVNAIVTAIHAQYGTSMNSRNTLEEIDFLVEEGYIYRTVDNFHVDVT